ncbi:PE-PGRS family protein [Streptomyces sp. NBC_01351]|uniref:PE-PGRS family protein n=1 Tax=Streptomyces sp. NBC_01351 TaxID=2903833 RepID=UPI002E353973|nr:PE-PGRS family protein [Streptomyces sp. NBC_01351]
MNDYRRRDGESYEALLATMGLEPVGTWWLPGIRRAATARRLLAAADGVPAVGPDEAAGLVLAGGHEFLLAFTGPHAPRGCVGNAWRRVRILATDPVGALAGLLTGADPDPRGLLLSAPDGETFAGTVPGVGGAPRLLVLSGVGARIDAAAESAAGESAEEATAAWAGFLAGSDPDPRVLEAWTDGLTANRSTPEDIRRDLLLRSPHRLRGLPPDELVEAVLAQPDPKLRLQAAEMQPHLTPAHWSRLIRAADTERERWILAMLAADRGTALAEETYATLVADPSTRVRAEAARLTGLPPRHAAVLAEDPDAGVRAAACRTAWSVLSADRREALRTDAAAGVRTEALLRHHEDEPLSREAYAREEPGERALEHCRLGPDLVEHLLATGDARLRTALAANPRLDPETVARLAGDTDEGVRHTVALRADLTEEQRAAIRVDVDPGSRSHTLPWVAELHEDPDAMRRLAASSHHLVRRSVARARRLPPDVVHRLAWDPDRVVQLFLAESCEDAPAEMLLRVWTWWTGSLSSPGRPRSHPNFPREGMLRYADDPHGRMRRLALDDPLSPPELVARFARDRDPEVRHRAAEDPRLPIEDAARLTEDPDDSVRTVVLRQRSLPASVLTARLRDPEAVRDAACNPGIPPHVIRAMATRCAEWRQGTAPASSAGHP